MRCATCGSENPEDHRFCGSCGRSLGWRCTRCGSSVDGGNRFCGRCGSPALPDEGTSEAAARGANDRGPPLDRESRPEERRRVTVLFADLVGFSSMAERLDPEELHLLVTATFSELAAAVTAREGRVEKFVGDALMAMFGAPVAHEDDPGRAVEAALAMLPIVERRSSSASVQLKLRIGINMGLVVSGRVGDGTQSGVFGDAVNVAARLQQSAEPGQILVSEGVWRRLRGRFEGESAGQLEVKGREQRVHAYRIVRPSNSFVRRLSPFVGRTEEIALLELLWSNATKGNPHVVSVVGEPGVGKSRLLDEFPPRPGALDIRLTCSSRMAYGLFLALLERLLGRLPADLQDLQLLGAAAGITESDTFPLVGAILGLSDAPPVVGMADDHQKRQVFVGVLRFLTGVLAGRPALLVLDDVQSADRSSLELLTFILERVVGIPLLVVLSHRPGFDDVDRSAIGASHTRMNVPVLSPDESINLARRFLDVEVLPADLHRLVASRAEGNPFFIEELLQGLLEMGALRVAGGRAILEGDASEVPDTVEAAVLARIDRLGERERLVLQQGAVIGRSFDQRLLGTLLPDVRLDEALSEVSRLQLLIPQGGGEWAFSHALIQEVVVNALLHRQRRELHLRVAEALELVASEEAGSLERLAEHYAAAGVRDKARRYAVAAGDAANDRMGFLEARQRYESALALWDDGDQPTRLSVLMKLGWAALLTGDPAAARTAMIEAEAGYRNAGDLRRSGGALAILGRVYFFTGDMDRAQRKLEEAIDLLRPLGRTPELVQAYVWVSILYAMSARVDRLSDIATAGLEITEALGLDGARAQLLTSLGLSEVLMCQETGIPRIKDALALAIETGEVEAVGRGWLNLVLAYREASELEDGLDATEQGMRAMQIMGAPTFEVILTSLRAILLMEQCKFQEAEGLCHELLESRRSVLTPPAVVFTGLALIPTLVRQGRLREASDAIEEFLPVARRTGHSMFLAPMLVAQTELEEARGNLAAAALSVQEAVSLVLEASATAHCFTPLVQASRVVGSEVTNPLLDRCRTAATYPRFRAMMLEASGVLDHDKGSLLEAASLYGELGLFYQQARALTEAGQNSQSVELAAAQGFVLSPTLRRSSST
jgi:adenylate cyclase